MNNLFVKIKESRWTLILLPFVILLVIALIFGLLTNGVFLGIRNLNVIFQQAMIIGIVATGACFIFATNNRNIAMGSCTALVATVAALAYNATGSIFVLFAVSIVFGVLVMLFCVMLSTVLNVKIIHVTIVMMHLLKAIQTEIVGGGAISISYDMTSAMNRAYVPYILLGVFLLFCIILFHFTRVGRHIKMVGANSNSAELTGLQTKRALLIAFILGGIGAGLGALLIIFRTGSITSFTGSGMNTDVMLAIVLGGMPVYGGTRSKAYAPILGAITVAALNNGLLMVGVSNAYIQGVRGIIFLILLLVGNKRTVLLPSREA